MAGQSQWYHGTIHFRTYFRLDWDVHGGYDLDFDPWPYMFMFGCVAPSDLMSQPQKACPRFGLRFEDAHPTSDVSTVLWAVKKYLLRILVDF